MRNDIAIVILNWNGAAMLRRYLPSVVQHSRDDARIIVADNGSTDDSLEVLRDRFPEVEVLPLDSNYGFAGGYNRALAQLQARYYVLLNSDVEVTSGWLHPLISYMDSHEEVAACQPKLLSALNPTQFEYAGACGGMLDRYGYAYCRGRIFDAVETDEGQYDTPIHVDWATGACLFIRADDFHGMNGFDDRYFAHFEEIDLCWRLRLHGRKIACVPQSRVCHLGGGTLPQGNPRKTYLNFRNNLTMLYKCVPTTRRARLLRIRWCLDHIAAWKSLLLDRQVSDFKAIRKARKDFRRWRKDFVNEADTAAQAGYAQAPSASPPICILWQFYARRRRKYSEIAR